MKPTLFFLFVVFGYTTTAQFRVTPQAGFENSKTQITLNGQRSFSPLGTVLSPQAALRFDYKFKAGHGPYIGLSTSRSTVKFNFANADDVMNTYKSSKGNTQLRLEGGYQVSSKPIYFKKSKAVSRVTKPQYKSSGVKKSCGSYMAKSSCGSKLNKATQAKNKVKGSWVRIQPSVGLAYIPSAPASAITRKAGTTHTTYDYNAGNWNTAFTSGIGFEFGKNRQSKFMVSVNYLKGMGNLQTQSITTVSGNKSTITTLDSKLSGWNVRMGIPISLSKKAAPAKSQYIQKAQGEKKCSQYRSLYKPKCIRQI